jgi:hypothetical protein
VFRLGAFFGSRLTLELIVPKVVKIVICPFYRYILCPSDATALEVRSFSKYFLEETPTRF